MSLPDPSLSLPRPPAELLAVSEALCNRIVNKIETVGALPFADFMTMALYEPGLGYYVNGLHKFGHAGDFVTAPEQGSLFAQTLASQFDTLAAELGPDWTLLEIGAGSGVLARDLLMQLRQPPARYLILDRSAALRQVQAEQLESLPQSLKDRVQWLSAPPEESFSGVILANEVIDALPVSVFELVDAELFERAVSVSEQGFRWTRRAPDKRLAGAVAHLREALPHPLPKNYSSEICLDLPGWMQTVTEPLVRGLALFIDYGYPRTEYYHPQRDSGTLVCHYRHRAHFDPFAWPGLTDISAFVDFSLAAEAGVAAGLELAGFTSQGAFLLALGAHERVTAASGDKERMRLAGELKRLVLPGEMGEKFKVLALSKALEQPVQGLEPGSQLHRL
ncbi:MAG: SAM-dependent methyltransferase [Wenzhouxiangella sp.]|nr:SAM-dependent methyltransferase [Wenzhouxiangella sp.]